MSLFPSTASRDTVHDSTHKEELHIGQLSNAGWYFSRNLIVSGKEAPQKRQITQTIRNGASQFIGRDGQSLQQTHFGNIPGNLALQYQDTEKMCR